MKTRRQCYSLKQDLTATVMLILFALWMSTPIWILIISYLPPKFSLQVVSATATGLDDATATSPPPATAPISTVFNMTLHVNNRRLKSRCYTNGEAAVRYSGHTVAWGRTMAFCLGGRETRDVPVVAWADGVGLPPALRERMGADWQRADGGGAAAAELEVDVKLFRAEDGSRRPAWASCKVMASGRANSKATKTFTPCSMFAVENWASDILDHLL